MKLPNYSSIAIAIMQILHASLFEIDIDMPKDLKDLIVSYKLDTINSRITVSFHLNDDKLLNYEHIAKEMKISLHDRCGDILLQILLGGLKYEGCIFEGNYESQELMKIDLSWSFKTIETKTNGKK